jgi:hypothetical protein
MGVDYETCICCNESFSEYDKSECCIEDCDNQCSTCSDCTSEIEIKGKEYKVCLSDLEYVGNRNKMINDYLKKNYPNILKNINSKVDKMISKIEKEQYKTTKKLIIDQYDL